MAIFGHFALLASKSSFWLAMHNRSIRIIWPNFIKTFFDFFKLIEITNLVAFLGYLWRKRICPVELTVELFREVPPLHIEKIYRIREATCFVIRPLLISAACVICKKNYSFSRVVFFSPKLSTLMIQK